MFLDASAMVAMLTGEEDADTLADRLATTADRDTSPIAIFETAAALIRKRGYSVADARDIIDRFLATATVQVTPIGRTQAEFALVAFDRFGKGRHAAALNMGDCFAYAAAKSLDAPLLYKGEDFRLTDIASA